MQANPPRHKRRSDAVKAAAAVFSERGYHGASTRQIADKLNIRQGSLYYYFDSKDAALEEVCRIGIGEVLEGLETIHASDRAPDEKICAALENHLAYLARHRHFVRAFLFCRHDLPSKLRSRVRRYSRRYEEIIEDVFAAGVSTGCFRPDLDCWIAAQSYFALINVAAAGYKVSNQRPIEQLIEGFSEQLIKGVQALH